MQGGSEDYNHYRTEHYLYYYSESYKKKNHHSAAGATEAAFGCNPDDAKGLAGERSEKNLCRGFEELAEVEVARTGGGAALEGKHVA